MVTKRVILIPLISALILLSFIPSATAKETYWLNELEADRVFLHYAKDIPLAEARVIVNEYQDAIRFVMQNYPLPYPANPRIEQFLVTSWRDYRFSGSIRHPGLTHMNISAPALYMGDFFRIFVIPVAGRHFLSGLSQLLYCRYLEEDPHVLASVARETVRTPRLGDLYTWYGSKYDPETAMYLSASFLAYLEETYGWQHVLDFLSRSNFEGSLEKDMAFAFGVAVEELEAGWLRTLDGISAPSAPRMAADRVRFRELTVQWMNLSLAYNRGELMGDYTLCRLLARSAAETEAFTRALNRFHSAILRAVWVTRLSFFLPVALFLVHLGGYLLRKRRMVEWFRARVKHITTESMVAGLSGRNGAR